MLGSRWLPHWNAKKPAASGLLTLKEAAEVLGVSYLVVYALANAGHLHAVQRDGKGRVYYPEWEVRAILMELYDLGVAA